VSSFSAISWRWCPLCTRSTHFLWFL